MKTKLLTPTFLILSLPFVYGQKTVIPSIHKVIVSDGILLQIERAPEYTLQITAPDADTSCLQKSIRAGILTLKLPADANCMEQITVNLTCPSLRALDISGKADITSRNLLTGDSLDIKIQGGGKAYLDLDINYLNARLIEGGLLSAKGYAVDQEVYVTTSATYSCFELEGDNIKVEASVGGKAKICAAKSLIALSKIGGYIGYKCSPVKIEKKGSGSIEEVSE
jgi:hypothetical protein